MRLTSKRFSGNESCEACRIGEQLAQMRRRDLLLIETDERLRELAAAGLRDDDWSVQALAAPPPIAALRDDPPSAVVTAWRFGAGTAEDFLAALRGDESLRALPVVLWTASDLRGRREELERRFAPIVFVGKPATFTEIAAALEALLGR